eukprot:1920727-Rhodomonas_salina.1
MRLWRRRRWRMRGVWRARWQCCPDMLCSFARGGEQPTLTPFHASLSSSLSLSLSVSVSVSPSLPPSLPPSVLRPPSVRPLSLLPPSFRPPSSSLLPPSLLQVKVIVATDEASRCLRESVYVSECVWVCVGECG